MTTKIVVLYVKTHGNVEQLNVHTEALQLAANNADKLFAWNCSVTVLNVCKVGV